MCPVPGVGQIAARPIAMYNEIASYLLAFSLRSVMFTCKNITKLIVKDRILY